MPLPSEVCQEYSLEPSIQDMPPGSDTQAASSGITEEPEPVQVIEAISDTPIPTTVEVSHHIGNIHQVIYSNSL